MNRWKKLSVMILISSLLFSSAVYAEGTLNPYDAPDGDALSLFDGLLSEGSDAISPEDSFFYDGDVIALDDLGISIVADTFDFALQDDSGFVYMYMDGEFIPYVMIYYYDTGWDELPDDFINDYTNSMINGYPDLRIADNPTPLTLSDRSFLRIRYEYAVSGYTASDTRLFTQFNHRTYMFASKEIESLGDVLPANFLEMVAGSMTPLAGGYSDYQKHVDSTSMAYGSGPSVGTMGGPGTSSPTGNDGGPTSGPTSGPDISVGGPVGQTGPVGRDPNEGGMGGIITFDENMAGYSGVWVEFTDGFKLYLPDTWNTYNLTQEQYNSGIFYMAGDTQTTSNPPGVGVSYMQKGDITLEDIAAMFEQDGCQVDGILSINGLACVSYVSEEENCGGLVFFHPEGLDYLFMIETFNYSYDVDTLASVLCSLTPTV